MITITKNKQYKGCPDGLFEETINETIVGNNDDRIIELEKQLHEQYAVNNNSNAGILISLISALLISFTGYGYVLYQYRTGECIDFVIVNLAAIIVMAVMMLLYCISTHFGAGQRIEQFITFGIRAKYYQNNIEQYNNIFPGGYTPFKKGYCDFVQGVYNMWSFVMIIAIFAVSIIHFYIVKDSCIVLPFGLIFIIVSLLFRCCKYHKYIRREKVEYKKHETFISKIQHEDKIYNSSNSVCQIACSLIMGSVIVWAVLFLLISSVYSKSDVDDPTQKQTYSIIVDVKEININKK